MTAWRAVLSALAIGAVAAVAGCLDALAPAPAPWVATVGLVPLFDAAGALGDLPADVDSIVITIHNPPAPDTTVGVRIAPGQDSIVISIDVPLSTAGVDTMSMGMEAIRSGPPAEVLYRADSVPLVVRAGVPTRADTIHATYVGPGAGILLGITLTPRSAVLPPGGTLTFAFTAIDSSGASCCATMPILWASRDGGVAQVSARGVVTARSSGDAWIVATSGASAAIKDSVKIIVATAPVAMISDSPATLSFTANAGQAAPVAQTVNVTNSGAGTLSGLTLTGIQYGAGQPAGWLGAALGSSTAPTTLSVQASAASLDPGTYSATVTLASAQAANSPLALPVTLTVHPVPAIGLTPARDSVVDTLATSDPAPRTIAIANVGTGTLTGLALGAIGYGAGQPTGWLTATLSGTTAPAIITLTYAKGTLPAGLYTATIPVTSTAAANSPLMLSAVFDVRPLAQIGLSPTALSFVDTVTTSDPAPQTVAVTNAGTGTLGNLAVGTITYGAGQPTGWLAASLSSVTAPAALTVTVAKGALAPGTYTATIPLTSPAAANSPQTVTVNFELRPTLPTIALTPARDSVMDTLTTSDPAARTISITNAGTGTLAGLALGAIGYGAGQPTGWLTATLTGTTAPTTITLTYAKGALPAGTYTATLPVTSSAATNSPQTLTAVFVVRPGPAIGLSTSAASFTDTILEADPAAQTVSVTNTSGGTLSGLALGSVTYGAGQPPGWLTATLTGTTAPTTITLAVAKGALPAGTYTATVPVTSAVASNSPQTLSVSLTVLPSLPAVLSVSATAPAYLEQVRLTFTGQGVATPLVFNLPVSASGLATGTVQVPAGLALQLTVEGFDSLGVKTNEADTTITLAPGSNPAMSLVLGVLNGDVTITWTLGSYAIVLDRADTTLTVGETLQFTATILDPQGTIVAGATPTWASTNPAIASVDPVGLARALAPGSTRIVATFHGAAASRVITVR